MAKKKSDKPKLSNVPEKEKAPQQDLKPAKRKKTGGRPPRGTKWRKKFIEGLRKHRGTNAACDHAGISRNAVFELKTLDPTFATEWEAAHEANIDDLEQSMLQRASDGWLEPVHHQGKPTSRTRKYSDTLGIFMLKQNRPGKYGQEFISLQSANLIMMAVLQQVSVHLGQEKTEKILDSVRDRYPVVHDAKFVEGTVGRVVYDTDDQAELSADPYLPTLPPSQSDLASEVPGAGVRPPDGKDPLASGANGAQVPNP